MWLSRWLEAQMVMSWRRLAAQLDLQLQLVESCALRLAPRPPSCCTALHCTVLSTLSFPVHIIVAVAGVVPCCLLRVLPHPCRLALMTLRASSWSQSGA